MWEARRLTTIWASTACYRDSFTFLYDVLTHYIQGVGRTTDGAVETSGRRKHGIISIEYKRNMNVKLNREFWGPVQALSYVSNP
jgi:hypothetical protein